MSRNDPYLPAVQNPADTATAVFDGSSSGTNSAIVSGLQGNFDAEIRYQAYDGSAWQTVALLEDNSENTTFSADWSTQFNRLYVSTNDRRIEVTNVSDSAGYVAADGDER